MAMERYKEISLDTVRAKIEEMRRRQAADPNFGVKKSPTSKAPKMSKEEKEDFEAWKKRREEEGG